MKKVVKVNMSKNAAVTDMKGKVEAIIWYNGECY